MFLRFFTWCQYNCSAIGCSLAFVFTNRNAIKPLAFFRLTFHLIKKYECKIQYIMQILDGSFSQHIHVHLTILMVSFKKQLFILVCWLVARINRLTIKQRSNFGPPTIVMAETLALTNKTNLKFWQKSVFFFFLTWCCAIMCLLKAFSRIKTP